MKRTIALLLLLAGEMIRNTILVVMALAAITLFIADAIRLQTCVGGHWQPGPPPEELKELQHLMEFCGDKWRFERGE